LKYPVDGVSVIIEDVLTTQPFASVTSKQYPFDVNPVTLNDEPAEPIFVQV
jgi:hypothetical protein